MQPAKEKNWILYGLIVAGLVYSIVAAYTEIPAGGADNYAHFNISRWAFRYPHLFLDHWGKPVFTILTAPFTQAGFWGVRFFNTICGLLTAWFCYKLVSFFNFKYAWITVIIVVFNPIYFVMMSSGMTEILFSLVVVVSVYLFFKEKYILSALLISFIFLVRTEGLVFLLFFLTGLIIKRQFKAIPFLTAGFLLFSSIGGIYYYHDFLWLINQRPYATGGTSVYGSGKLYYFIEKMPFYFGYAIPVFLFGGTAVMIMNWFREKVKLNSRSFIQLLLIPGCFWGYFCAHSYLWWIGETSAGLYRVMAGVSPLAAIVSVFALDFVFKHIQWKSVKYTILISLSVFLLYDASNNFYRSVKCDSSTEILKRATHWLKESGCLNYKLVMHDPYFAFSTGLDAWNNQIVQYGFSDNNVPENGLPDSTLFIWDAHFSANEGRLPLEKIMSNPNFKLVQYFEPEIPFKVLGNNDYKILIFQKITSAGINNYSILENLTTEEIEKGIYYVQKYDFDDRFQDQNMEMRRLKKPDDSLNFWYNLNAMEFSPTFLIRGDTIKKDFKNKFRITSDFCCLEPLKQNRLLMVFSAEKNDHSYYYVTSDISEQIKVNNVWCRTEFVFKVPEVLESGTVIKSYIWNIDKKNVLMDNFKLEIAKQMR